MSRVGVLGLGSMGAALAGRLLEDGHEVVVWNRSPGPVRALVERGAREAAGPGDALATPVSLSMLANDDAALGVLDEAVLGAGRGGVHVNAASISPQAAGVVAARAAAAGTGYVSAPVLGRPPLAAAGELTVLAAGADDAVEAAGEVLGSIGRRTWRLGTDPRTANVVKVCVNYNLLHTIQSLGESLALAERHGVDPATFADLLGDSLFGGIAWKGYSAEIAARAYEPPGFSIANGRKDLGLARDLANEVGLGLPTLDVLERVFARAAGTPSLADVDWAAAAEVTRQGLLDDVEVPA